LQYGLQYGRGLDRLWHQGLLAGLGRWWRDGFSALRLKANIAEMVQLH
jgi:hypothetical protein